MDYLLFDLLAVALPAALLLSGRPLRSLNRATLVPVGVLAVLALLWTAPWDEHLVRTGVWTYAPGDVLGRFGAVPVEEYLFVVLEVVLVAAWARRGATGAARSVRTGDGSTSRRTGALSWLAVALVGAALVAIGGHLRYAGLLLVWAAPPLALQRAVGGDVLRVERVRRLRTAVPVVLWLCLADRLALAHGIWTISSASATGITLLGLPGEEALFFGLTTVLVTDGLLLGAAPLILLRVRAFMPLLRHPDPHARTAARHGADRPARGRTLVALQPFVRTGRPVGQHHGQPG